MEEKEGRGCDEEKGKGKDLVDTRQLPDWTLCCSLYREELRYTCGMNKSLPDVHTFYY